MKKLAWGLKGVVLPIITPFHPDLSIDWEGLGDLIEYYIEDVRTDGIVPCGTTGESPTLSHAEHAEVIRFVVERVKGRVPVIAGAGSNSTREAIELTRASRDLGVDATLQVCPYYNKPTQTGLFDHFSAIAADVDLPIILYNIPGRTARNIDPATIVRLWREVPQIVGLKDASNDLVQAMTVLRETDRDTFSVYSGEDVMTFSLLCLGAAGAIAAVAHVIGPEIREMCDAVWAGGPREGQPHPLLADADHRRPVPGAESHSGQTGRGLDGAAGGPSAAAARRDVRGRPAGSPPCHDGWRMVEGDPRGVGRPSGGGRA